MEWTYLFEIVRRFGLGESLCNWVKLLYMDPYAEIITNHNISKPILIRRGYRQRCPLSPLLFIMAVEPFAVREHNMITGIKTGEIEHQIALYADDFFFSENWKVLSHPFSILLSHLEKSWAIKLVIQNPP